MRVSRTTIASSLLAGLASPASATTCFSGVNVFTARGTGEQPPTGFGLSITHIRAILAAVPNSNATVIDYPASFANNSVPIGVTNASKEISSYLDACPDSKIVVMGYSQGADVMGYVLTGANFSVGPDGQDANYTVPPLAEKYGNQVAAVVFFGDPQFNVNTGINADAPYPCNVSSDSPRTSPDFEPYAGRLQEWCNSMDLFCCSTGHTFAGHISYFSESNATITGEYVANKLGLSSSNGTQTSPSSSAGTTAASEAQSSAGTAAVSAAPSTNAAIRALHLFGVAL